MQECDFCSNEIDFHEIVECIASALDAKGAEIPVGARILAICDGIDAMTSNRCYRKALSFEYCYNEIEKNLGTMYDPIIGRYVLDNWEEVISVVKYGNACDQ